MSPPLGAQSKMKLPRRPAARFPSGKSSCGLAGVSNAGWTARGVVPSVSAVPNSPKTASQANAKGALPFEEALKQLEAIVEAMEAEELPLEALIQRYEEGVKLVQICQAKLAEAEVKIQQLERDAAGEMKLKPVALEDES